MELFELKNKSVLITGSSRGIGKSIAWQCAKAGAKVIISSRKYDVCEATAKEINDDIGGDVATSPPISSLISLAVASQTSYFLLEIITLAPALAHCHAIDLPIPLEEPVIKTLLFLSSNSSIALISFIILKCLRK